MWAEPDHLGQALTRIRGSTARPDDPASAALVMVLQALGLVALGAVIPTAAMLAAKLRPRLLRSVAAKASSAAPTWTPTPPPQKVGGSRQQ